MALSVNSDGSQVCTVGTEHTLGAAITTPNVFDLNLDLSASVGGATPDIFEVREYMTPRSGGTERLLKVYTIIGAQVETAFKTIPRVSAISIRYTIKQTQGTGRTVPWAVYQAQ